MPPAAAIGAGALIGAIPGIVGAATGAGKSTYSANNFSETKDYDPNKFKFGGREGLADEMAGRYGDASGEMRGRMSGMEATGMGQVGRANDYLDWSDKSAELGMQARGLGLEDRQRNLESRDLALQSRGLGLQSRDLGLQSRGLGLESRGVQGRVRDLMVNRAEGRDLVADRVAALSRNDLSARMRSAAASARGPAALASAQSDAMAAEAQGLGQIHSQHGIQAMEEQKAAEQAAFGAASGMREGDTSMRSGDLGMTQNDIALGQNDQGIRAGDLGLMGADDKIRSGDQGQQDLAIKTGIAHGNIGTNLLNTGTTYGQQAQGWAGLERDVRQGDTNAAVSGQTLLSGSHTAEQGVNSRTVAGNADADLGYIKMIAGGVEGGAKMGMNAPGGGGATAPGAATPPGREDGGPVQAGKPYVVGEAGKELFVPKTDGTIVPNHAIEHKSPAGSFRGSDAWPLGQMSPGAAQWIQSALKDGSSAPKQSGEATPGHRGDRTPRKAEGIGASLAIRTAPKPATAPERAPVEEPDMTPPAGMEVYQGGPHSLPLPKPPAVGYAPPKPKPLGPAPEGAIRFAAIRPDYEAPPAVEYPQTPEGLEEQSSGATHALAQQLFAIAEQKRQAELQAAGQIEPDETLPEPKPRPMKSFARGEWRRPADEQRPTAGPLAINTRGK